MPGATLLLLFAYRAAATAQGTGPCAFYVRVVSPAGSTPDAGRVRLVRPL